MIIQIKLLKFYEIHKKKIFFRTVGNNKDYHERAKRKNKKKFQVIFSFTFNLNVVEFNTL